LMLLQTMAENTRLQPSPDSALASAAQGRLADIAASAGAQAQAAIGDAGTVPVGQRSKRWVSPVEEAFAPMVTFGIPLDMTTAGGTTGLSHYLEAIVGPLVSILTDLKDSPIKPSPKVVALGYATAQRATSDLLESTQTAYTRPLLSPLLLSPVDK
jgi:hypothetical protein